MVAQFSCGGKGHCVRAGVRPSAFRELLMAVLYLQLDPHVSLLLLYLQAEVSLHKWYGGALHDTVVPCMIQRH